MLGLPVGDEPLGNRIAPTTSDCLDGVYFCMLHYVPGSAGGDSCMYRNNCNMRHSDHDLYAANSQECGKGGRGACEKEPVNHQPFVTRVVVPENPRSARECLYEVWRAFCLPCCSS